MDDRRQERNLSAVAIAREAGNLLLEFRAKRRECGEITKGGSDFATQADLDVDEYVLSRIREDFPEDEILSEESAPKSYAGYEDKPALWVVDPLDGTTNFSLGEENYAVSIAFVSGGVPLFGVIHQPARQIMAVTVNDQAIRDPLSDTLRVSSETDPKKCTIGHNWYYTDEGKRRMLGHLGRLIPGGFRAFMARGSAVGDLLAVADGRLHAYIQENLKPWDVAAAGLMVQLAGGTVTGIDGTPWHPFRHDILASNGHLHPQLLKLLNDPIFR